MYEIAKYAYGRPIVRVGPMSGCRDFPRHAWLTIGKVRSKTVAIKMADETDCRCVVVKAGTCNKIYDNGKPAADLSANEIRDHFLPLRK